MFWARHWTQSCILWAWQCIAWQQPPIGVGVCEWEWEAIVKCSGVPQRCWEVLCKCRPFTLYHSSHSPKTFTLGWLAAWGFYWDLLRMDGWMEDSVTMTKILQHSFPRHCAYATWCSFNLNTHIFMFTNTSIKQGMTFLSLIKHSDVSLSMWAIWAMKASIHFFSFLC